MCDVNRFSSSNGLAWWTCFFNYLILLLLSYADNDGVCSHELLQCFGEMYHFIDL